MAKSHLITFQDDNHIEPLSGEGVDRITLAPEIKGGSGSGNFGHAGRPGQVGGSAEGSGGIVGDSSALNTMATRPTFDKRKMNVTTARWLKRNLQSIVTSMQNERDASSWATGDLRKIVADGLDMDSKQLAKFPSLQNFMRATASILRSYPDNSSNYAVQAALTGVVSQLDEFLAEKRERMSTRFR